MEKNFSCSFQAAFTYRFNNWILFLVIKPVAFTHDKKSRLYIAVLTTRNETLRMCERSKVVKTSIQTRILKPVFFEVFKLETH